MTTILRKDQMLLASQGLFQQLSNIQNQINEMPPKLQVKAINGAELQSSIKLLSFMQERVRELQLKKEATAEELEKCSSNLKNCNAIVENLEANQGIVLQWKALKCAIREQGTAPLSPERFSDLKGTVSNLKSNSRINQGNTAGLDSLNLKLDALAPQSQPVPASSPAPSVQTQRPLVSSTITTQAPSPAPVQQPPVSPSNVIPNEESAIANIVDEYSQLMSSITTMNPELQLSHLGSLYKKMKEGIVRFSPDNASLINELMKTMLVFMNHTIVQQRALETNAASQAAQPQQGSYTLLSDLRDAIEKSKTSDNNEYLKMRQVIEQKSKELLNTFTEDYHKIFDQLQNILKSKPEFSNTLLPAALKRFPMTQWPGSNELKLQAVEQVLADLNPPASVASTPVVSRANAMQMYLNDLIKSNAPQPAPITTTTVTTIVTSTSQMSVPPDAQTFPYRVEVIATLDNLLPKLASKTNEGLSDALEGLVILESMGYTSSFQISGPTNNLIFPISLAPSRHLAILCKKEARDIATVDDPDLGNNAMAGQYLIDNELRIRSIQRTIVELALEELEGAINDSSKIDEIGAMLLILEGSQFDGKDLPAEGMNFAHFLFWKMYVCHNSARQTDSSLADPNDMRFRGDFGRNAFYSFEPGIKAETKVAAIQQLRDKLKEVWIA